MKNESDYLWDKTGEPDADIQQLEEILGTLRYQPRPLEIPAGLAIGRERNFFRSATPRLAIAATIAMLLLGLGVWLAWQRLRQTQNPVTVVHGDPPAPAPIPTPTTGANEDPSQKLVVNDSGQKHAGPSRHQRGSHPLSQSLAAMNSRRANNEARQAKERQEAVAAKDQLLLALRVVSAKLSFAQKKTQSPNAPEPIHNQHKIG